MAITQTPVRISFFGGDGFLLLFAEPDTHAAIIRAVPKYQPAAFAFEDSGSQVIFYRP